MYGGSSRSFECLDVDTALESCMSVLLITLQHKNADVLSGGGCMIQNPFIGSTNGSSYGIDCTTIVGANDVACVGGKCTVTSCASGYRVSNNRDGCKAVEVATDNSDDVDDIGSSPARMLKKRAPDSEELDDLILDLLAEIVDSKNQGKH